MICNSKIYKGGGGEISIGFSTQGWTDLYVEYYTDGESKVVKYANELDIDEYTITATFSGTDLDVLKDGIIYYAIHYVLDGVEYIKSSNTPYVLKTQKGYSAMTPSDYYHEGEVVGKAEGYASGYTAGEEIGYQEGYNQGQADCPTQLTLGVVDLQSGDTSPWILQPTGDYDGFDQVQITDTGYGEMMFQQGYGSGRTSFELQSKSQSIDGEGTGLWNIYPDEGYDGMDRVTILDDGYGQAKYSSGYTAASNYYRANRRQYAWSGTVTFNRDFTFGTDQFGIFIYGKDFSGNPVTELVDEGYQSVNGRVISPGDSWSAGTYPYIGMFEEVSIRGTRPIKDGYLEEPIFFHQGDGSFNVKLFFLQ